MDELEGFKRGATSKFKKALGGGVALFPFLDEAMVSVLEELHREFPEVMVFYEGGIQNSDRTRAIVSTYPVELEDFKISVYEILYNDKYYELYHRSILGSLMSLGIKRECIGDIIVSKNKKCYFAVSNEIEPFILEEFHQVGKCPIELRKCYDEITNEVTYEDKLYFLASMRLDVVISEAYGFSRSEALEVIKAKEVFVNHVLNQNPSHIVKESDLVSVRHKGRVLVSKIGGTSKSGRIAVTLSKIV